MFETPDQLAELPRLLDAAHGSSTQHLRSVITDERRLTAAELAEVLTGMQTLNWPP